MRVLDLAILDNCFDEQLKKKEEKELGVGGYITGCLLTKQRGQATASKTIARWHASVFQLLQFDYYS